MSILVKPTMRCNSNCEYCLAKGTLILTADYQWIPIEDIKERDILLAFPETFRQANRKNNRWFQSRVERIFRRKAKVFKVITSKGNIIATANHKFLDRLGRWRPVSRMVIGQTIKWISQPAEIKETKDYKFGYVKGLYEGDGTSGHYIDKNGYGMHTFRIAMTDFEALQRAKSYLEDFGYSLEIRKFNGATNKPLKKLETRKKDEVYAIENLLRQDEFNTEKAKGYLAGIFDAEGSHTASGAYLRIASYDAKIKRKIRECAALFDFNFVEELKAVRLKGGASERLRFISLLNPAISRKKAGYQSGFFSHGIIKDIIPLEEEQEVFNLQTSTRTYWADGFAAHNCYEDELRRKKKFLNYDLDKVLESIEQAHKQFKTDICFHGGEILLLPKNNLEKLFKKAFELAGKTAIQTNGLLINDDIIKLFKKYKTGVGLSIDGPDELNKGRWREKNRERTEKVIKNIYRMRYEKISVGLISVISKYNCLPAQRQKFKDFILEMKKIGCPSGRMNPVLGKGDYVPTIDELKNFYFDMCDFTLSDPFLQWQPFRDIIDNLMGFRQSTCIYHQCDYFWTSSAHVVLGDGSIRNCMKTVLGHNVLQGQKPFKVRYEALFNTPKEYGGCKDCRYWSICSGLCPSEGIEGDWRNKSIYCEVFYALYEKIEKIIRGLFPRIKLATDYKAEKPEDAITNGDFCKKVERLNFSTWRYTCPSKKPQEEKQREERGKHGDSHSDWSRHGDSNIPQEKIKEGHGDSPHGDHQKHGDGNAPQEDEKDHRDSSHGDYSRHGDQN